MRPVPRMRPPVLVQRELEGTALMIEAAFSSGVGSIPSASYSPLPPQHNIREAMDRVLDVSD